jgi:RNA polymerase sigma-54 factor
VDQRLSLKLGQKLVLTPTLQQAIKLLQLSKLELIEHIRQEMEENPVLEESTSDGAGPGMAEVTASSREEPPAAAPEETALPPDTPYQAGMDWSLYGDGQSEERRDAAWEDDDSREAPWYENVLSTRESLRDYLQWQLHLTLDGEEELASGEELIGNIDDDGYLRTGTADVAELLSLPEATVEGALRAIQSFDPPGVGARSVEECLTLQLARLEESHPLAETIVREHLKRLENRSYEQIAHALRRPLQEVLDAARLIGALEPKPGRLFSSEEPQYVIPDLYIHKEGDDYRVTLNDEGLPKLRVSRYYRRLLLDDSVPAATKDYISKKFSSALWLVKSIHQRQRTIFRVAESIVRFQRAFFEQGIEHMRPMVLRDVADDIGVHESTVSRVTTRKYAQTPQGLFELKFFFNTGIERDTGQAAASTSVQTIIRRLLEEENPESPLSDQAIAASLRKSHGLVIARRTVAKYRSILRILPASKRRRIAPRAQSPATRNGEDAVSCT